MKLFIGKEISVKPDDFWVRAIVMAIDHKYVICEYKVAEEIKTFSFMKEGYELDKQVLV